MRWKPTGEVEINVGVLGNNNDILWEFRDFLVELGEEADYKISMMLAKDQETILRVMSFIPGGFDIMLVVDHLLGSSYLEFAEKALSYNADLRMLFKNNNNTEFVDGLYPNIMFIPNRDRLKILTKQKINLMIVEKMTKEKQNEQEGTD